MFHIYIVHFGLFFSHVFSGWKYLKPWMSSPAAGSPQCVQAGTRQGLSLLGVRFGMESRCVNSQIWITVLSLLPGIHPHLDGPVYFPRVRERVDAAYHSPSWPWACCQLSGAKSPHEYPSDLSDTIWWHVIQCDGCGSSIHHWTIGLGHFCGDGGCDCEPRFPLHFWSLPTWWPQGAVMVTVWGGNKELWPY